MSILKTIQVDDFFTTEQATNLASVVLPLQYRETEFGKEIDQFNMTGEDTPDIFSKVLKQPVTVIEERSGTFRKPELFIHFEDFADLKDWCFCVALLPTQFSTYHHKTGARTALEEYRFNYGGVVARFDWNMVSTINLEPGQGIFFRPWLFHSFNGGLIQMFRLREASEEVSKDDN